MESTFTIQPDSLCINGFVIDSFASYSVLPGMKAVGEFTVFPEALEDNDITVIESAEIAFHIYDPNTWQDIVTTDPVTLTF